MLINLKNGFYVGNVSNFFGESSKDLHFKSFKNTNFFNEENRKNTIFDFYNRGDWRTYSSYFNSHIRKRAL